MFPIHVLDRPCPAHPLHFNMAFALSVPSSVPALSSALLPSISPRHRTMTMSTSSTPLHTSRSPSPPSHSSPTSPTDPSDPDSRFAEIDGVAVHHKLLSPSTAPSQSVSNPLAVCLHGFGANLSSFELCDSLNQLFSPLIAYDTPGFGLTSRPTSLNLYTSRFSARIARSLALAYSSTSNVSHNSTPAQFSTLPPSQPVQPYVLIGHSLGSVAATYATITHPSEILALILIAPAILPSSAASSSSSNDSDSSLNRFLRFLGRMMGSLSVMLIAILTPILIPILRWFVSPKSFWANGLKLARGPDYPPTDEAIAFYRRPIMVEGWEQGILKFTRATLKDRARALQRHSELSNDDYVAVLASLPPDLAPPVLIVHGDKDNLVPVQNSTKLAQLIPNASLVIMKGLGHTPHEEDPQAFTNVVSQFLEDRVKDRALPSQTFSEAQ